MDWKEEWLGALLEHFQFKVERTEIKPVALAVTLGVAAILKSDFRHAGKAALHRITTLKGKATSCQFEATETLLGVCLSWLVV